AKSTAALTKALASCITLTEELAKKKKTAERVAGLKSLVQLFNTVHKHLDRSSVIDEIEAMDTLNLVVSTAVSIMMQAKPEMKRHWVLKFRSNIVDLQEQFSDYAAVFDGFPLTVKEGQQLRGRLRRALDDVKAWQDGKYTIADATQHIRLIAEALESTCPHWTPRTDKILRDLTVALLDRVGSFKDSRKQTKRMRKLQSWLAEMDEQDLETHKKTPAPATSAAADANIAAKMPLKKATMTEEKTQATTTAVPAKKGNKMAPKSIADASRKGKKKTASNLTADVSRMGHNTCSELTPDASRKGDKPTSKAAAGAPRKGFLVDDDDQAVLKEALAFIDACGTSEGTAGSSGGDGSGSPLRGAAVNRDTAETLADSKQQPRQTQPQNKTKTKTKKRRIKTFASSSTCQLQRKKAEALSLREQLLELEAHLALLRRTKYATLELSARSASKTDATTTATASVVRTELYERALTEFVRRQRSEKTNRTLKAVLANQQQVCGSLRSVLQKRSVLHGLDVVFENPPSAHHPLAALDHSVAIIGQLEKRVENLYIDADSVFQSDAPPLVTANMQVKHSKQHGKVVEIETVTPVACSIQEASAILWKDLKTVHEIPDKRYRYVSQLWEVALPLVRRTNSCCLSLCI
ncbi:hypothetical protein BBJ28_00025188, partial [Nothophytophthora sp. Chile5]